MAASISVCLERCQGYERKGLQAVLERVVPCLGELTLSPGTRVLLKPNLISASAPSLACTHAGFVVAVAAWFLDHGCRVVIGDSPAFGSAINIVERQGMARAVREMNIQVVEFASVVYRRLSSGISVGVAAEALDCDLLVNLPKIKAHDQMYVSMAVKNIFGIVKGPRKSWLHMRYGGSHLEFARIILDLQDLLPENITLADGIEVMHRHGPMHGELLSLGCLAASRSPVALDTAMLALLELEPGRSPLWRVARDRALPGAQLSGIEFPLLAPADFVGSGFVAPEVLNPVRFRPLRYIFNSLKRVVLGLHRE
ncbi:MAG: DUF362 domain-containing protein [Proteobacteria bacterium]|nr:DUF362 domain-containing protein [Pseudomonadota bacterium]MBU1648897.1 DUF362 domain-containing protein [Pseudomonadota bacterium]